MILIFGDWPTVAGAGAAAHDDDADGDGDGCDEGGCWLVGWCWW